MNNKIKTVCNYLEKISIEYEIIEHSPASTIEECKKIEEIINDTICKNLLLRTTNGAVHYLLVLRNDKRFVTGEISKKLGSSRLSFASGEEMLRMLNTTPGSLSILSLIFNENKDVTLAIDKDVTENEFFCCHPCDNTATLKIKTSDILSVYLPSLGIKPTIIDV